MIFAYSLLTLVTTESKSTRISNSQNSNLHESRSPIIQISKNPNHPKSKSHNIKISQNQNLPESKSPRINISQNPNLPESQSPRIQIPKNPNLPEPQSPKIQISQNTDLPESQSPNALISKIPNRPESILQHWSGRHSARKVDSTCSDYTHRSHLPTYYTNSRYERHLGNLECPLSGAVIIPEEKTTSSRSQRIRKLDPMKTLTADRAEDVGGVGPLQGHRELTPPPGD